MRRYNALHYGLLLLISLLLGQCSEETALSNQPRVFATFEVRYLAEDLQLRGQAHFTQGDSIQKATPISLAKGVAFMGSGTKMKQLPGGVLRYETTLNTAYTTPARFNFTLAQEEKGIELSFPMNGIADFEVVTASKAAGLKMGIEGGLAKDESLLLLFTDLEQKTKTIVRPGPLTSEDLIIPSDALLHFQPGEYRMFMVKSKEIVGAKQELDYQAIVEYYTKEKSFVLSE